MLEKIIERKLVVQVKRRGGLCPKFVSPGSDGMPDRLVLLPGGKLAFVELKAPGARPRPLQLMRHAQLRALGFSVFVIDDPADIHRMLELLTPRSSHARSPQGSRTKGPAGEIGQIMSTGKDAEP